MNGKSRLRSVALLSVCAAVVPSLAFSETGWVKVAPGIHRVPDDVLSSMRGKYVSSTNQVVYFGVQMSSNWSAPNGTIMSAGSNFSIDVSAPTPKLRFKPSVTLSAAGGDIEPVDKSKRYVDDSGVDNISGMTQSIQVAGDDNVLENVVRVSMLDDIPDIGETGGKKSEVLNYSDGSVSVSAQSSLTDDAIVVKMGMKGQGEVEQSIRGYVDGLSGKGGYQQIRVLGDRHVIVNRMGLDVVMRKESQSFVTQQTMGSALNSLRGMKPNM